MKTLTLPNRTGACILQHFYSLNVSYELENAVFLVRKAVNNSGLDNKTLTETRKRSVLLFTATLPGYLRRAVTYKREGKKKFLHLTVTVHYLLARVLLINYCYI